MTIHDFSQLGLRPQLVQTLDALEYTTPTPIQAAVIPTMITGQDILGQAQTGTGKTAAFSLPILHNLEPKQDKVQALVLAPTRELAVQVAEAMQQYGQHSQVRVLAVYGGQPYSRQKRSLRRGVDIVVGTPGRLLDLIKQNTLDLSFVSTVVLDEADEMLSMGFIEDIEAILDVTPKDRQTALFSATLPQRIRQLAENYMQEAQSFSIERKQLTVETIEQRYYLVNEADKAAALMRLFEVEPITSALIFAKTRVGTGELANELTTRGLPAEALNGDLNQDARERILDRFRRHQIKVLVATDVAARGLDIDDISHVFNFDLPQDPEVYVHRVGRTGRAGRDGVAITLLTPKEQWRLRRIESYAKQKITKSDLPSIEDIQAFREEKLIEQVTMWVRRNRSKRERAIVADLIAEGHSPLDVAAAALKVARAEEKQRPIAPISEVRELPARNGRHNGRRNGARNRRGRQADAHEEGMVRLSLNFGRRQDLRVNQVVGVLARYAKIPGSVIGRIRIQDQHTLIDVPEEFVGQVLAKNGAYRIGKQKVRVELA
ncbi:MAG: DEAD/DEAH box helicase [Chloroflexota bacterium]